MIVGDGSYLMMNSEIATSVMLGAKLIVVVLDNRGYGCINRLQQACGGAPFNNLLETACKARSARRAIDFAAHARALGAQAEHVANIAELEAALQRARAADRTYVISIDTDPARTTDDGGWWWEVAVPEVSPRDAVRDARAKYEAQLAARARTAPARSALQHRPHRSTNEDARMTAFDVRIGINPLVVDERRSAFARRRDAARGRADGRPADRLSRLRTRQQVSARTAGVEDAARAIRSRARVRLVFGTARATQRRRGDRRRRPASRAARAKRRDGDGVRRSRRFDSGRAAAALSTSALFQRRAMGRVRRRASTNSRAIR